MVVREGSRVAPDVVFSLLHVSERETSLESHPPCWRETWKMAQQEDQRPEIKWPALFHTKEMFKKDLSTCHLKNLCRKVVIGLICTAVLFYSYYATAL